MNVSILVPTKLIFRFESPPTWYFLQIEIKISQKELPQHL